MKLGADRKKLIALGVLVLIGGWAVWSNLLSGPEASSSTPRPPSAAPAAVVIHTSTVADVDPSVVRRRESLNRTPEFKPSVVHALDLLKVDPTLRLDLLAKVQHVEIDPNAQRNLFEFGAAAPVIADNKPLVKVAQIHLPMGPVYQPPPPPPGPAVKPPPPPITLKYYGYSTPRATGNKRAFFLDGEDIIVASEGELIKRRYKLIKIGVNSVTMEDTEFSGQQTLPLAPDAVT